ncbi:hypothetical protein J7E63_26295 [Bacillus sp. ISL-75]|uniref:hypothetical protein n=1 Tax=Bacillus sp. ISL-75 TaxID=2819137 RepID=UPI001BE73270|nr:hypothetical protein [Bacillus sp. ISL-75]MBT2730351.1 hypothetical protein [Bacillus sp. ISL-75]
MKLLGLGLVLVFALTGCNDNGTTRQQLKDNNVANNLTNVSDVPDNANEGHAIGKEFGGKGTGYGQVKKKTNAELIQEFLVSNGIEYSDFQKSEYGYKYKVPSYSRQYMDMVMEFVEKNIKHEGAVGSSAWWTYGGYWVEIQVQEK